MALWGSFAFKTVQLFIPVWFHCRISGTRGNKRRMTAATPCIVLHSLSGSPFYCRFPPTLSWGELGSGGARVCAEVPRLLSCGDAIIWRDRRRQKPAGANGDGRKASSNHPRVVLQTLMVHDAAAPWDTSAGKWPPFPRRRDENASQFPSESLFFLRGLNIWNSLLAGNAARKSPGEFRLMINLLPIVERLLEAGGEKVGRNLLTRVRGAFPQTVGQVFPSLLVREHLFSSVLINRWAEATGTTWKRWALRFRHVSERLSCRY